MWASLRSRACGEARALQAAVLGAGVVVDVLLVRLLDQAVAQRIGGAAERVTFTGSYNISPTLSPDGRWLAYISRVNGAFKLTLMELAGGGVTALTDSAADESPSFAPNGRLIVYATQQQGREVLMTTTLDGRIKARLSGQSGNIREPDWGPFQK